MVLCLVTLTDLQTRRAGLSASAELLTGRMPGKLPVLFLLTGQKSGFSPRRGDSLHRFKSVFAVSTGTWVCLIGCAKFHVNRCRRVRMRPPKYQKFQLFGKESPRSGDSLDRFPKFFRGFYTTNYPTLFFSNFMWFASQVTELLRGKRASVN